ncbi:MAG TPA: NAD(+) synthase [Cyclobacteriaceae bacterium]|nr:NAD(+) synthase [Cyclobacteriaceae bacterium]
MTKKLKIAGATVNQTPIDWQHNTQNILNALRQAQAEKVDLLCFPELSLTGYGCEDLFLTEWVSAKAWDELQKIVPEVRDTMTCIGMPVRIEGYTYNGVCVVHQGQVLGITLKQNLARDGVHYEPRWFEAWKPHLIKQIHIGGQHVNVGDLTFECKGVSFGFEICEDAWRSIRPADHLIHRNVDLILNPSASHFAMSKSPSREELVKESSRKYNCVYGYVNLLGNEAGRMIYDGDILFARDGELILRNPRLSFKPFVLQSCTIDFSNPSNEDFVVLPDIPNKNQEFAQSITLALFDYLRKSKSKGFVLSLSGGADSSCCAVVVAEMLNRAVNELGWATVKKIFSVTGHNVKDATSQLLTCAYQGTRNSSVTTLEAARNLAESIGAGFFSWTIDDEVKSYTTKIESVLERKLTWEKDDIALQNIQARARSPIIWMLANIKNALLLTTSNRSEGDVGYATMDGDTSGSLAPIAGVDKPFIIQWLKWAEQELGYSGLSKVNALEPTAELRPEQSAQTDEKDLMPYDLLVRIEKLAIRDRKSPKQVYEQLLAEYKDTLLKPSILKFYKLWARNQWKRERIAPSFHLDDINVDPRSWCRFPILSGGFEAELAQLEG